MKAALEGCGVSLLALAGVLPVLGGCNVDYAFPGKQPPRGPVESWPAGGRSTQAAAVDISVVDANEADLVEEVVAHRQNYHQSLRELQEYYRRRGYATKAGWAAFELDGLRRVRAFRYLLDAEVASDRLRPTDSVVEADQLYEEGLRLMRKGGHGVPGVYRQEVMVEAAETFRRLIADHPSSDKIDDAAFMLGEIHKEYMPGQEVLAVKWYERAWTWDPMTPHPARFEAAVVYDYRLQNRDRALELYHQVVDGESADSANARFASRRIRELSE